MKASIEIKPAKEGRSLVTIKTSLTKEERKQLPKGQKTTHQTTNLPIPCNFHTSPNPQIMTVQGEPLVNGTPEKCYVLKSNREVALNRPIPHKTPLKIHIPSKTILGYIETEKTEILMEWWKECVKTLSPAQHQREQQKTQTWEWNQTWDESNPTRRRSLID
jgi:hypothetical protein